METYLPDGLLPADHPNIVTRAKREGPNRLRLRDGRRVIQIAENWGSGFALDRAGPQPGRGFVDLFEGERHLRHCLVYKTGESTDRTYYGYKLSHEVTRGRPLDFARRADAPVALLRDHRQDTGD